MHKEEQHESVIDTDMHDPSESAFFQSPDLEQHIQNKDPDKGEHFFAQQGQGNAFDGGTQSFSRRKTAGFCIQWKTKPRAYLIDQAEKDENDELFDVWLIYNYSNKPAPWEEE